MQLEVHEHDAYYNHYRTKSLSDYHDDPLRSSMPILEAAQVLDTYARGRFLAPLKARLALCGAEGLCPHRFYEHYSLTATHLNHTLHLPATPTNLTPLPSASDPRGDTSGAGVDLYVKGESRPPLSATLLERTRGYFDECSNVAEAIRRLLPRTRQDQAQGQEVVEEEWEEGEELVPVVDLEPGTGYYMGYLAKHGYKVTGLDADGELSASLVDLDLRLASPWRGGSGREVGIKALLPAGNALLLQVFLSCFTSPLPIPLLLHVPPPYPSGPAGGGRDGEREER